MNESSTTPAATDTKSAGVSFFEVLAGTSAQSSAVSSAPVAPATGLVAGANSDTAAQSGQANAKVDTSAENQTPAHNTLPQTLPALAPVAQNAIALQSLSSQPQTHSNTNATSRAADHQAKPQPASTSSPAAITLPADVSVAQSAAIVLPPVPSPAFVAPLAEKAGAPTQEPANATAGVSAAASITAGVSGQMGAATGVSEQAGVADGVSAQVGVTAGVSGKVIANQAAPVERINSQSQNKPQAPAPKASDEKSGTDANTTAQTVDAASSESAGVDANGNSNSPVTPNTFTLPVNLILPSMNPLPGLGDLNQSAGNAAQASKTPDTNFGKFADAAASADAKKSSDTPTGTVSAISSNSSSSNNQPVQRTQADASQPTPVSSKATDGSAPQITAQIQTMATHGAIHDAAASHTRADGAADAVRSSDQPVATEAAGSVATAGINTANLIQKMSETEMRVGMHSADFGEVSIRTSVSQQQMLAQISVDHGDLGKAISAHIPAMEAKIGGDSGLRALVEVNQSGMSFSGERGFSSQREQKAFAQTMQNQDAATSTEADQPALQMAAVAGDGYRLDIRA